MTIDNYTDKESVLNRVNYGIPCLGYHRDYFLEKGYFSPREGCFAPIESSGADYTEKPFGATSVTFRTALKSGSFSSCRLF